MVSRVHDALGHSMGWAFIIEEGSLGVVVHDRVNIDLARRLLQQQGLGESVHVSFAPAFAGCMC
jgi:hypothetical protein